MAAAIPWVQADPTPLRTSNAARSRRPGARASPANRSWTKSPPALGADPRAVPAAIRREEPARRRCACTPSASRRIGKTRPSPAPAGKRPKASASGRGRRQSRATRSSRPSPKSKSIRSTGEVTVKRVTMAHDCGLIINPDGLKNQIEGNIIQGVSRDADGRSEVRCLRDQEPRLGAAIPFFAIEKIPDVDIVLIDRQEMPALGGGEPAIGPIPAAIANAIFDATGVRLRERPSRRSACWQPCAQERHPRGRNEPSCICASYLREPFLGSACFTMRWQHFFIASLSISAIGMRGTV